ncbi:MAG: 16S rRNA (guanine(966)-N(2))-methyltransferase RsmD [Pseudomonadota bacterium]
MRIVAGRFRSIALAKLGKGDAAAHLRPTSDRVRESLFNILTHHNVIHGARVLDLFAGTGALGLEALSRGAAHVTFVDDGRVAQRLLTENIDKLRVTHETAILRRNALHLPRCERPQSTLIFLDPPYGKGMGTRALDGAVAGGWLAQDAFVVLEENAPISAPAGFVLVDARRFGDTHVTLLSKSPE